MNHTGSTRSRIQRDHALITPESHVPLALPGWEGTRSTVLISPHMGAHFVQYLASVDKGGVIPVPAVHIEQFVYILKGCLHVVCEAQDALLNVGGYAFFPAGTKRQAVASLDTEALVLERVYVPGGGSFNIQPLLGRQQDVAAVPLLGNEDTLLQTLLPNEPAFDMGMNILTFNPGATLPLVETHFMEHGLLMLAGQGIYRLGDSWYPVVAGDAIWMAPYCLQWFAATGKQQASYIYYKDMNRSP